MHQDSTLMFANSSFHFQFYSMNKGTAFLTLLFCYVFLLKNTDYILNWNTRAAFDFTSPTRYLSDK